MNLIFVHGIAQEGRSSAELESEWTDALKKGFNAAGLGWPAGVTVRVPFYGDNLKRLVDIHNSPLMTHLLERGVQTSPLDDFRAAMLAEMAEGYGIKRSQIQAEMGRHELERAPQNWRWVLATARALDHTPLGGKAIDLMTRDVSVYLSSSATRRAIDSIVAKAMSDDPCVVVGHSLGSVVSYNILRSRAGNQVRLYATLGSPLGIKVLQEKNGLPLKFPAGVKHWFNARDKKDIVALYPLDDGHFYVRPKIEDDSSVTNWTENHHSIPGYLTDKATAAIIHAALTGNWALQATEFEAADAAAVRDDRAIGNRSLRSVHCGAR